MRPTATRAASGSAGALTSASPPRATPAAAKRQDPACRLREHANPVGETARAPCGSRDETEHTDDADGQPALPASSGAARSARSQPVHRTAARSVHRVVRPIPRPSFRRPHRGRARRHQWRRRRHWPLVRWRSCVNLPATAWGLQPSDLLLSSLGPWSREDARVPACEGVMAGAVPERGGGGPDFLVVCWRHPKITVASRNSQVDRHDQAFVWTRPRKLPGGAAAGPACCYDSAFTRKAFDRDAAAPTLPATHAVRRCTGVRL